MISDDDDDAPRREAEQSVRAPRGVAARGWAPRNTGARAGSGARLKKASKGRCLKCQGNNQSETYCYEHCFETDNLKTLTSKELVERIKTNVKDQDFGSEFEPEEHHNHLVDAYQFLNGRVTLNPPPPDGVPTDTGIAEREEQAYLSRIDALEEQRESEKQDKKRIRLETAEKLECKNEWLQQLSNDDFIAVNRRVSGAAERVHAELLRRAYPSMTRLTENDAKVYLRETPDAQALFSFNSDMLTKSALKIAMVKCMLCDKTVSEGDRFLACATKGCKVVLCGDCIRKVDTCPNCRAEKCERGF